MARDFLNPRGLAKPTGYTHVVTASGGKLVFISGPDDGMLIAEVRNQYFSTANPPASTLVGVQALAREGFLVEIEATALVE